MNWTPKYDANGHQILDEEYFEMLIRTTMEDEQEELPWNTAE